MSISFFIPNAPKKFVNALEEFPNLIPEDFHDDPFIKWRDNVPYIEESALPSLNVTIHTYYQILKNVLLYTVDDKESVEEGFGKWSSKEELQRAKIVLLSYLATGAQNDVKETVMEGTMTIIGYNMERIEGIVYGLVEVIDSAIEHDMSVNWG